MKRIYNDVDINDVSSILAHIEAFTKSLGIEFANVDRYALQSLVHGMRKDFPHSDGVDRASPFKKTANFLCYFINQSPIKSRTPDNLGEISKFDINVITGLDIAICCLYHAELHRDDCSLTIENRIKLTKHSYIDMLEMLKTVSPSAHFHVLSLLLEQLTYKTNPECQYTDFVYE